MQRETVYTVVCTAARRQPSGARASDRALQWAAAASQVHCWQQTRCEAGGGQGTISPVIWRGVCDWAKHDGADGSGRLSSSGGSAAG